MDTAIARHFRITIHEVRLVPFEKEESTLLEKRHYTDAEIDGSHRWMRDSDKAGYTKELFSPHIVKSTKEVEAKVFEQIVQELDLKAVIFAVNKVPDRIMYDPNTPSKVPQVIPKT